MKKLLLFLFVISFFSFQSKAQSHFILAGQDTGLMYTQLSYPQTFCNLVYNPPLFDSHSSYNLDFNNDGIVDVVLYCNAGQVGEVSGYGNILIGPDHEGVQLMKALHNPYSNGCFDTTLICLQAFSSYDSINNEYRIWTNAATLISYGGGGAYDCDIASSRDSSYYIGGRIISNTDTFLFYLHIVEYNTRLSDYAIEGKDTTINISTSIKSIESDKPIKVFPNPFTDQINLTAHSPVQFKMYDGLGRMVKYGTAEKMIKTEDLLPGLYFLSLQNGETYFTSKIIKNE